MWIHDPCFYQFDICRVLYTRRDENDFSIAMVSWGIPCVWSVWREMKQQTTTISSTGDADDDTHVCTYIGSCPQSWAGTSSRRPRHRISREYGKNSRPFIFVLCRRPPQCPDATSRRVDCHYRGWLFSGLAVYANVVNVVRLLISGIR